MKKEKVGDDLKEILLEQDKKILVKLIIKQANKYPEFLSSLIMEYGDKEEYEQELFDKYSVLIGNALKSGTRYRTAQLHNYQVIKDAVKLLNVFCKHCNNKILEADLTMQILRYIFKYFDDDFDTAFVKFDNKTAITLQRAVNLVTKKIHPDFQSDYIEELNQMITFIKSKSNSLDSVYKLEIIK